MSGKEIATRMGYADSCHLNKLFVRHYGVTPIRYRKNKTSAGPDGCSRRSAGDNPQTHD